MHFVCLLGLYSVMTEVASCFLLQTGLDEWSSWTIVDKEKCLRLRTKNCVDTSVKCNNKEFSVYCPEQSRNSTNTNHISSTENPNKLPLWSEWEPWECHREQIGCLMYRHRHCINGAVEDCEAKGYRSYEMNICTDNCKAIKSTTAYNSVVTKLPTTSSYNSVVTKLPTTSSGASVATPSATKTPIYWTEWSGWKCQDALGSCLMTNTRNCSNFEPRDCEEKLGGPHYELTTCRQEICPAHWLAWGEWKCKMGNRGICNMTRTRECSTGSTDACGRISSETTPCEKQVCPDKFDIQQSGRCNGYNASTCTDVPSCSLITNMHELLCQFKDTASDDCPKACGCCDEEPHWLQWSVWECYLAPHNTCRMRRTRTCSTANIKDCKGMSEIVAVCSDSICPGLKGLTVDCGLFDSQSFACRDGPGCLEFRPYLSTLCSLPREVVKCPLSCGCCAQPKHMSTTLAQQKQISTTGVPIPSAASHNHLSTRPSTTSGSISTLITAPSSQWSEWFYGKCSVSCGNGTTSRLRHCNTGHDEDCTGKPFEKVPCSATNCPVNGAWSEWTQWSKCSKTCDDGTHTRMRMCNNPAPLHGGLQCNGAHNETAACKYMDCPHWLDFKDVSSCSVTCGTGFIQLKRNCSTGNQSDCTGSPYTERPCNLKKC